MAKKLTKEEIQALEIEHSHYDIDFANVDWDRLRNPFGGYYSVDHYMQILRAIRDPANFFFTCKYIFNVEPTVFQLVWLDQLWHYSFPMLIAGRGASKSFTIALYFALRATITQGSKIVIAAPTFRQSKLLFDYIEGIWSNAPVWRNLAGEGSLLQKHNDMLTLKIGHSRITAIPLGTGEKIRGIRANYIDVEEFNCLRNCLVETDLGLIRIEDMSNRKDVSVLNKDGQYEKPIRYIKTPTPVDVYKVTTEGGFTIECSEKHKVLTTKGYKLAKDLSLSDCLISENKYKFPNHIIEQDGLIVDENLAWLFGIYVSEGDINNKNYFRVKTTDLACANKIKESILKIIPNQHITWSETEPYISKQWNCHCKKTYTVSVCNQKMRDRFEGLGLDRVKVYDKKIPWSILQSSRPVVVSFLSALFNGDGSIHSYENNKYKNIRLSYHTVSKQLADEVRILTKKLGYFSSTRARTKNRKIPMYEVMFNGIEAYNLGKELDVDRFNNILSQYQRKIKNGPTIYYDKSKNNYQIYCRVDGKNKKLGIRKTQEEAIQLYNDNNIEHLKVISVEKLPEKDYLYDIEIPSTNSFYGNGIVQHNSVNEEIFEIVLRGFTATSSNPVQNIKMEAKLKKLKEKGLLTRKVEDEIKGTHKANQIILSGTAGWDFQPFAKYWKRYHAFIQSRGDKEKVKQITGSYPDDDFSYKDYTIIRMPADLLPRGMMDAKAISNAKQTMDPARFDLEFGAIFSKDSNGFFPRTLIESCVTKEPIQIGNVGVQFSPRIKGDPAGRYILSVDPASESDNLAITIIENYPDHNRVVYCWTVIRKEVMKRFKEGNTDENNFYAFIARKIRNLMKVFPIEYIAIDSQGGGISVMEHLHDVKRLEYGEVLIWPIRKDDPIFYPGSKDYGYDDEHGLHIIEMVNMSNAQYTVESNHGMRKDLMNKMLLFPYVDAITVETAELFDKIGDEDVDTLQNCIYEIEQLKDELSTIVHTTTLNGRDRFDTPDTILAGGKKGKLRKDRYSSLLMCNMLSRRLFRTTTIDYSQNALGGFATEFRNQNHDSNFYNAPEWFAKGANNSILGKGVCANRNTDPFSYYHQR